VRRTAPRLGLGPAPLLGIGSSSLKFIIVAGPGRISRPRVVKAQPEGAGEFIKAKMDRVAEVVRSRPLLVLGATNAATAFVALWLHTRGQGGMRRWLAKTAFRTVVGVFRVVASDLVTKEEKKIKNKTMEKVMGHVDGPRIKAIPQNGMPKSELVALMQKCSQKETKWREGKISGTVYHSGSELSEVICEAFKAFASSNPIHPDVFPTCRKMEAGELDSS
jgi:hypothetical protein